MAVSTVVRHARESAERERTILVGAFWAAAQRQEAEEHLDELERLVDTAGGVAVERCLQERQAPDPATLVGIGFVHRLAELCTQHDARTIVFDADLTGSQVRNIEAEMPDSVKVLDRAAVILDIFAQRARSREAQTQVELAQLSYLMPRLTRRWRHLSRQAGGIGTRGVGETQLEIDRRIINHRISQLRQKLVGIERDRRSRRQRRQAVPAIALVGYTNAGKSSLFRRLTNVDVLVEDRLFATLDPRTRQVDVGEGVRAVLTDTVGFIRKLPHHLLAPFRSTLEEATEADIVLHVLDASHPSREDHLRVGNEVLDSLDVDPSKVVVVFNKIDLLPLRERIMPRAGRRSVQVSAVSGDGIDELRKTIREEVLAAPDVVLLRLPLEKPTLVEQAINLPHLVARRFRSGVLEIAVRTNAQRLAKAGLGGYIVPGWDADEEGG